MQQESLAVCIVNIPGDPTRNHSKGVTNTFELRIYIRWGHCWGSVQQLPWMDTF